MSLAQIETAIRKAGGSWNTLFRRHKGKWHCILFPLRMLTEAEYSMLTRRLSAPQAITPEDRKLNNLRARAQGGDRA